MRGAPILVIFFLMFTVAALLIPTPIFPGNFLCMKIGTVLSEYALYLSAVFNGIFYGIIVWVVFVAIGRRLEQEK